MNTLYTRLSELCQEKEITIYKMCLDLNLSPGFMTDLKAGRRKGVNANTANKLSSYFGVSVSYLLGETDIKVRDDDLEVYLTELRNREEMRMLFDLAKDASKDDVERAVKIISALKN